MKFYIFSNGDVPSRACQIVHIEVKSCCGLLVAKTIGQKSPSPHWSSLVPAKNRWERSSRKIHEVFGKGFEAEHRIHQPFNSRNLHLNIRFCMVQSMSHHENESTIKEYSTTCSDIKKKEMFDSLSDAIKPKSPKIPKIKPSATVTKQDDMPTPNPNFDINFDLPKDLVDLADGTLQEIDDFNTIDDEALAHLISDHDNANTNNNNSF